MSDNFKFEGRIFPTKPFTNLKLQNPAELHKTRRSPDLEALKLRKGSSGCLGLDI